MHVVDQERSDQVSFDKVRIDKKNMRNSGLRPIFPMNIHRGECKDIYAVKTVSLYPSKENLLHRYHRLRR